MRGPMTPVAFIIVVPGRQREVALSRVAEGRPVAAMPRCFIFFAYLAVAFAVARATVLALALALALSLALAVAVALLAVALAIALALALDVAPARHRRWRDYAAAITEGALAKAVVSVR